MVIDPAAGASFRCSIAPWLSVRNGAQAVEFYKSAFGATEVYRLDVPGGGVVARLSVDGAEFWLSDESPEHGNFSPESRRWRFGSNDLDCGGSGRCLHPGADGGCIRGLPCRGAIRLAIGARG